jgi:hypothetical protein
MVVICPTCRAPSNTSEARCWVCHRLFDGSEPVIGEVPGARQAYRLSDVRADTAFEIPPWRRARAS